MIVLPLHEFAGLRPDQILCFLNFNRDILQKRKSSIGCPWESENKNAFFCSCRPHTNISASAKHALLRSTSIVAFPLSTLARNSNSKLLLGIVEFGGRQKPSLAPLYYGFHLLEALLARSGAIDALALGSTRLD